MTLRIGCSPITGTIYIGSIRKRKDGTELWANNRTEVTQDAVDAVIGHLSARAKECNGYFSYEGQLANGKKFELKYIETEEKKE